MPERVTITVDGKSIEADKGALLIEVAQTNGVYIPRFCWHERMKPVGMCRMCLVQIEGQRGLPPACTATINDGMVVNTQSPEVKKAQEGVLEFLLINHPLDCPVCDRGGECPLQDHTMGFGPGESRFVEEKRHFVKPIPISELVYLDRERCILCARCTRFADEIAGDPLISFVERAGESQVLTFPDDPFTSYFSGNTVQICPVGALTAKPYRFRARPWDLASAETSCQACAVGCQGVLQSSSDRIERFLGADSEAVNHGWLCDKGRFGFDYLNAPDRVSAPMVRKEGELVEVSWPEALDAAADRLREAIRLHGPESVAVIGGARGMNEDAYVWSRFVKGVLRTDNFDCQLGDGLPAEVIQGVERATIADCDNAKAIVLLGPDLKEELPVLYLRLRRAAVELGVPLIDVSARDNGLSRYASAKLRYFPGDAGSVVERLVRLVAGAQTGAQTAELTGDRDLDAAVAALCDEARSGEIVVVLGRPSLAERPDAIVRAAGALASLPGVRFLSALRRGNVHGALDMGLAPGMLPGRVTLEEGRAWFEDAWGGLPAVRGLDTEGILRAATEGKIRTLVILGSNAATDFPDRALAKRALGSFGSVIAVGAFVTEASKHADVVLPVALWGEKSGTTTNLEGRVLRLARKVTPAGTAMSDWRIAAELALRFDVDFDLESAEEVEAEISRVAPAYRGVDGPALSSAADGIVVPMRENMVTIATTAPVVDASDADAVADVAGTDAAIDVPPAHVWDRRTDVTEPPPPDSYALRLVAGHTLYDAGLAVSKSPSLSKLPPEPVLLVSPTDSDRLGVVDGGKVRVASATGSLVIPVRADAGTPKGVGWIAFNQTEVGASDLIDAGAVVTDVRVETA